METIELLWTFAPDIKVKLLAVAIALQAFFTVRVYAGMSRARFAAAKAGKISKDDYKVLKDEPEEAAVYTRAIANQFELPVLFFAIIVAGLALGSTSWITVVLAFLFVALKAIHIKEFVGENTVMKRRKLFVRSAQVFLALLAEFTISALLFAQG